MEITHPRKYEAGNSSTGGRLMDGGRVVELEPRTIEESFVMERLSDDADASIDILVRSIKASGQLVPILVRPIPGRVGRFQVAFGHRRVQAAELLQCRVKAIVRALSDEELVVAQGKENTEHHGLSFIEKAVFAKNLEDKGFSRNVLMAALSVDKTELTRLLTVTRSVPGDVIRAIGPARKAGRPRWLALARMANNAGEGEKIQQLICSSGFKALNSDRRFEILFATLSGQERVTHSPDRWMDPNGRPIVRIDRHDSQTRLLFDDRLEPDFSTYIVEHLEKLYAEFRNSRTEVPV